MLLAAGSDRSNAGVTSNSGDGDNRGKDSKGTDNNKNRDNNRDTDRRNNRKGVAGGIPCRSLDLEKK